MEDEKIVDLFLDRDESAISHVAEKYGSRLCTISYRITKNVRIYEIWGAFQTGSQKPVKGKWQVTFPIS